jgi:hypothetical protein
MKMLIERNLDYTIRNGNATRYLKGGLIRFRSERLPIGGGPGHTVTLYTKNRRIVKSSITATPLVFNGRIRNANPTFEAFYRRLIVQLRNRTKDRTKQFFSELYSTIEHPFLPTTL